MGESKKLTFNEVMSVLLDSNDEKRKEFILQNRTAISITIGLACRMVIDADTDEKVAVVKCLARISEVESEIILDNLLGDQAVYETIIKPVTIFIRADCHSPSDEKQDDFVKYHLILLVNITRQKITDQIVRSLLVWEEKESAIFQRFNSILTNVKKAYSSDDTDKLMVELTMKLLLNLSQSPLIIAEIEKDQDDLKLLVENLLQFFEKSTNLSVRSCCILIIVNFLIHGSAQEVLLNPQAEIIVKILYPLTGPTATELDDEDMARLPLDLQYLPPTKERESETLVRDALISCLLLCCNTKNGRDYLKANGTYYILRELHKWESDRSIQKRIEDVVDILIKEEDEYASFPNLMSTKIPDHLLCKFDEMDQHLLNE